MVKRARVNPPKKDDSDIEIVEDEGYASADPDAQEDPALGDEEENIDWPTTDDEVDEKGNLRDLIDDEAEEEDDEVEVGASVGSLNDEDGENDPWWKMLERMLSMGSLPPPSDSVWRGREKEFPSLELGMLGVGRVSELSENTVVYERLSELAEPLPDRLGRLTVTVASTSRD